MRTRRHLRRLADDRGAAAVEFAIVLPVLLLILFGIIEFARAWNVKQTLTDAAREGTRVAVVAERQNLTQAELQDSVRRTVRRAVARAALDTTGMALTVVPNVGGNSGTTAQVAVSYLYTPLFGTWVLPSQQIELRTTFVMRNE
jgi:Flp pilus assembly protein TadG